MCVSLSSSFSVDTSRPSKSKSKNAGEQLWHFLFLTSCFILILITCICHDLLLEHICPCPNPLLHHVHSSSQTCHFPTTPQMSPDFFPMSLPTCLPVSYPQSPKLPYSRTYLFLVSSSPHSVFKPCHQVLVGLSVYVPSCSPMCLLPAFCRILSPVHACLPACLQARMPLSFISTMKNTSLHHPVFESAFGSSLPLLLPATLKVQSDQVGVCHF